MRVWFAIDFWYCLLLWHHKSCAIQNRVTPGIHWQRDSSDNRFEPVVVFECHLNFKLQWNSSVTWITLEFQPAVEYGCKWLVGTCKCHSHRTGSGNPSCGGGKVCLQCEWHSTQGTPKQQISDGHAWRIPTKHFWTLSVEILVFASLNDVRVEPLQI